MTDSKGMRPNDQMDRTDNTPSWKAVATIMGIAGISTITGFGYAYSSCRNKDSSNAAEVVNNAIYNSKTVSQNISESGFRLAVRAFGWATILASFSVGSFSLLIWVMSGANNMKEFNVRMRGLFPTGWRINSTCEDTTIKTFSEFCDYLSLKREEPIEK